MIIGRGRRRCLSRTRIKFWNVVVRSLQPQVLLARVRKMVIGTAVTSLPEGEVQLRCVSRTIDPSKESLHGPSVISSVLRQEPTN